MLSIWEIEIELELEIEIETEADIYIKRSAEKFFKFQKKSNGY